MFNSDHLDPDDAELFQESYNAIKQKEFLEPVTESSELDKVLRQILTSMTLSPNSKFFFQNLFKINLTNGHFYIAQCVIDFGFSTKRNASLVHEYKLQLIGIANLSINLGRTMLRSETKLDKLVDRFFDYDIDFTGTERFNDKYYLVSNRKNIVEQVFDKKFIEAITRHNDVLISTLNTTMFIHFSDQLSAKQSAAVEDIFNCCQFLTK